MKFFSNPFSKSFKVDGLIGMDALKENPVLFEFPKYMTIFKEPDSLDLNMFNKNIEELIIKRNFIILNGRKNDLPIENLILDTGAGINVLNEKYINDSVDVFEKEIKILDLSGIPAKMKIYSTNQFCLLTLSYCEDKFYFIKDSFLKSFSNNDTDFQGILGLGWLIHYKVLINFKENKIGIIKNSEFPSIFHNSEK